MKSKELDYLKAICGSEIKEMRDEIENIESITQITRLGGKISYAKGVNFTIEILEKMTTEDIEEKLKNME